MFSVSCNIILPGEEDPSRQEFSTVEEAEAFAKALYDKICGYFVARAASCTTSYTKSEFRSLYARVSINHVAIYKIYGKDYLPTEKVPVWFIWYESGLHAFDAIAMYNNESEAEDALKAFPQSSTKTYYVRKAFRYASGELDWNTFDS